MELVPKTVSDESNLIAQVEGSNEKIIVDKITAVQNWAMQSPDWKLLNVLFEIVDVQQL